MMATPDEIRIATRMLRRLGGLFNKATPADGASPTMQYAILLGIGAEINRFRQGQALVRKQMAVATATGRWLDVCGRNYGVRRPNIGLNDIDFREFIGLMVTRPKVEPSILFDVLDALLGVTPAVTERTWIPVTHDAGAAGYTAVYFDADAAIGERLRANFAGAADRQVETFSGETITITHDAGAAAFAPVYIDEDAATYTDRLLATTSTGLDSEHRLDEYGRVTIKYDAAPGVAGVAVYYDETNGRLAFVSPTTEDAHALTSWPPAYEIHVNIDPSLSRPGYGLGMYPHG